MAWAFLVLLLLALGNQLTSNSIFFDGNNVSGAFGGGSANTANGGFRPQLYAPNPFRSGSSISHLSEAAFPSGNPNALMTPSINSGEVIRNPGPIALGILQDLGYDLKLNHNLIPVETMGQVGQVTNLTHNRQTVTLDHTFKNPMVFALSPSINGGQPVTTRLSNITSTSFDIEIDEPNNLDGWHLPETVSFIVLEEGSWQLADGTNLQVGKLNSNLLASSGFENVTFDDLFNSTPVVFTQVQTLNDADFVRTRHRSISKTGFQVAMEEEEIMKNSGHLTEAIGWFAFGGNQGAWSGLSYEAGQTEDIVTHNFHSINFTSAFTQAPQILASIATYDGNNPSGLRYRNLNNTGVELKIEEDTSADDETIHTTEKVDYFSIQGKGLLQATSFDSLTGMSISEPSPIVGGDALVNSIFNTDTYIVGETIPVFPDENAQQNIKYIALDASEEMIAGFGEQTFDSSTGRDTAVFGFDLDDSITVGSTTENVIDLA